MAGRGAHHGGLNWEIDDPGEHGRATERGTGGGGWFIRSPDPTKSMGAYLGTLRTRFVGCFQGHDSPAEVRKWFASTEAKMTTRVIIGRELFPTLTPALASHWAASLTAMLFTATVPPRVAAQGNVLFQTPAEYATAGILFGELRRRFIVPLAHLLLYELVCQEKRAEIAQALTQQRGAAQAVGDVDDYSALKELLSSPAFTLLESLEDAVWAKGVAVALQSTSAVAGATRTVVLAMRQEQNDLFNYATVGHETAIAAGRANNALAVFTIGDLEDMCARVVLGHHLKKTIPPRVLEVFKANHILLTPAVQPATAATIRLQVPLPGADAQNVVNKQDMSVRKAWLSTFSSAVSVKQSDKKAKRSAPAAIVAEAAAVTSYSHTPSAAFAKRTRFAPQQRGPEPAATVREAGVTRTGNGAEPRFNKFSNVSRQQVQQPPRGGTGPPAAAANAARQQERGGPRRDAPAPSGKRVPEDYVCWNCAAKGDHWRNDCTKRTIDCSVCHKRHAAGPCLPHRGAGK